MEAGDGVDSGVARRPQVPGRLPAAVLALALPDDVLEDGGVVAVEGRGPGQVDCPRREGHDQWFARRGGNI